MASAGAPDANRRGRVRVRRMGSGLGSSRRRLCPSVACADARCTRRSGTQRSSQRFASESGSFTFDSSPARDLGSTALAQAHGDCPLDLIELVTAGRAPSRTCRPSRSPRCGEPRRRRRRCRLRSGCARSSSRSEISRSRWSISACRAAGASPGGIGGRYIQRNSMWYGACPCIDSWPAWSAA